MSLSLGSSRILLARIRARMWVRAASPILWIGASSKASRRQTSRGLSSVSVLAMQGAA